MAGDLSVAETVVFGCVLLSCLASVPLLVGHVTGRSRAIDEAVGLMASSARFRRRLAGGFHLTWGVLLTASLGALAGVVGLGTVREVAGIAFLVLALSDLAVFLVGRPRFLVLPRHRA